MTISHNKSITGKAFVGKSGGGLTTAQVYGLKYLDISYCRNLSEGTLHFVSAGMVELVTLIVSHYPCITPNEIEAMAASSAEHLEYLDVGFWDLPVNSNPYTAHTEEDKKDENPKCQHSNLGISSDTITIMASKFNNLSQLNLCTSQPSQTLSALCFSSLFQSIPTLEDLNLGNNVNVNKSSFSPSLSLTHLRLEGCPHINNLALKTIASCFPNLSTLLIPDTELIGRVSDEEKKSSYSFDFLENFTQLTEIDLTSAYKVDDEFLLLISSNNPNLAKLKVGHPDENINKECQFTMRVFFTLTTHNPKLTHLTLSNSAFFGNFHHDNLPYPEASSLPHLVYLDLSDTKHLTTQSLIHICHTAPQLQTLKVSDCPQIQHSHKIGNIMASNFNYIEISEPPFVGFTPVEKIDSLYFRDAFFSRIELEKKAIALIMKNYKCWKRNVLWRWWSSAKKIKKAFRLYKFKSTCREYTKFTTKLKKRRMKSKKRRRELMQRVFQKIRNACITIQTAYRRYDACCIVNSMLDEIDAATSLQAAWRGLKCRLQDHLWVKKKERELKRLEELIESGVFLPRPSDPFEIDESIRKQMPVLREQLDEEVKKEIKMTFNKDPQPRRFDEEPYVELPFNRRLPIFGGKKDDAYEMNLTPDGVHVFGGNLWPPAQVIEKGNEMKEFFDPTKTHYQNYCEMLESKNDPDNDPYNPMPKHSSHPKCTLCSKRYMSLTCVQCCTSYCVQCSTHIHSKPAKKHHNVVQYHHEYIQPRREVGIIPHLNAAKLASKKLLALTDMAQNDAELAKIEEAKQLEREMEEAEEEERLRAKEAAETEQRIHDAANVLQHFQEVCVKRARMRALMDTISTAVVSNSLVDELHAKCSVSIQKAFRGHSVRRYFYLAKIDLTVYHDKDEIKEIKPIIQKRVEKDFENRRQFERGKQIVRLEELKKEAQEKTDIETKWCNENMEVYEKLHDKLKGRANAIEKEESEMRAIVSKLNVRSPEYYQKSMLMKIIGAKKTHNKNLIDNVNLALRWLTVHLRQTTRRIVQSKVQSSWASKHLMWIDDESKVLRTVDLFVKKRLEACDDEEENKYYKEWLLDSLDKIVRRLVAYDTEQESLLERSLARYENDKKHGEGDRANIVEILSVLKWDRQFDAEKVGNDIERMRSKPLSDENLRCLERAAKLKAKQQKLMEVVLPKLSKSLEISHSEEDKLMSEAVVFKNDYNGISRHKMHTITAVLKNQPKARKTMEEERWMDMFRSQPWLTRQNVEEGRLTDQRKKKRKELNQKSAILEKQRKEVEKEKEDIEEKERKIIEYQTKAESQEVESELEKRDLKQAAETLRQEIDLDAPTRERREAKLKEEEDALVKEIKTLDDEDAMAAARLKKQSETIEKFRDEELKGDKVALDEIAKEKKELEAAEEVFKQREAILQEEVEAGGGDVKTMAEFEEGRKKLQKRREDLEERERLFEETMDRREQYYLNAKAEAEEEMRNQQLKHLQEDIRERKKTVIKAQRELEEQLAEEAAKIKEEEEAKEKANWQAKQADDDIKSLGVRGVGGVGGGGNKRMKPITAIKQYLRKQAGTRDDPEQLQMVSTIKKRMKIKGGQVEAIRAVKFTVGSTETDEFTSKQSTLQTQGMPFFRRIGREIGLHDQIVIWVEKTVDQDEFITELELSHTDQNHDLYINLLEEGWERSGHPKMRGETANDPSFCVWTYKAGPPDMPIGDLNLSYTLADEEELRKEGFEMLETSFLEFGFGDMNLWVRKVERAAVPTFANSAHVAKELHELRKMLAKSPDDEKLMEMEEKLLRKLHAAQVHEDESRENADNPIKYTMEFLALNPTELEQLITYFSYIDLDRDGFISMEEFSHFVGCPMSDYVHHIFKLTDALDEYDRLDFGETIKAIGTFCMLQGDEILKLLFAMFDPEGEGYINNDQLLEILSVLHPHYRGRTTRTLKEFDLPKTDKVTFEMVRRLHIQYPNMFHPAYHLQDRTRKTIFGLGWWEAKLRKYMATKQKLFSAQITTNQVDLSNDLRDERKKRKKERKHKRIEEARANKSQFVRALYIAKNVADALIPDIDVGRKAQIGQSLNPFTNQEEREIQKKKEEEEAML